MSTTSRMQKYMRALAPRPYDISPEQRVEIFDALIAISKTLTNNVRLLIEYRKEVSDWLGVKP